MPQLSMLNHAAWAEHKNSELRYEAKKSVEIQLEEDDPFIPDYGMRLSKIKENDELYEQYLTDWSDFA